MPADDPKVLPFSRSLLNVRTKMARGRLTSPKPSPSSQEHLSATAIEKRLVEKLKTLDGEQLQIIEIVVAAIIRGA